MLWSELRPCLFVCLVSTGMCLSLCALFWPFLGCVVLENLCFYGFLWFNGLHFGLKNLISGQICQLNVNLV